MAATFKDTASRTWTVSINVGVIRRVRKELDVDLARILDDKFAGLRKLLADPVQLVDVLYLVCRDEADKLGVSDEAFGLAMAGDAVRLAADALVEELVAFAPTKAQRDALREVLVAARKFEERVHEQVAAEMEQGIDVDAAVAAYLASKRAAAANVAVEA